MKKAPTAFVTDHLCGAFEHNLSMPLGRDNTRNNSNIYIYIER